MGLETASFIDGLNELNPVGATDPKSQGDDHIRLIKATIKATFPNIVGAVTPTEVEINLLGGATGKTGTGNLVYSASPTFTGTPVFPAASIADAALSANVPLKDAANVFTAAQQLPTVELGHASDTTLARIAAGRVSIEGGEIAKLDASQPFTVGQFIEAVAAQLMLTGSTSDTNEKSWRFQAFEGVLSVLSRNDADNAGAVAIAIRRALTVIAGVDLYAAGAIQFQTKDRNTAPATTGAGVRHADNTVYDVGLNVMPMLTVNAAVTFDRAHVGKLLNHSEATARAWTTPASTDTDVPLYSVINIVNSGAGAITLTPGSGITLARYNGAGAGVTGARVLSQGGVATMYRAAANTWLCWGNAGLN